MRIEGRGTAPAGPPVTIRFDGTPVSAFEGEAVMAALVAAGRMAQRRTRSGAPRGVFCGMGVCQDCLVTVDGVPNRRACMTPVVDGLRVETQGELAATAPPDAPLVDAPREVATPDLLIVGGGPAGMTAALAAAARGLVVTLVDERPALGGQYFKQLSKAHRFEGDGARDAQFDEGGTLVGRVEAAGVRILRDAEVWGAFPPDEVAVAAGGRTLLFRPRRILLATGSYERAVPFPGWTLPGVMTTGAAQTLLRAYRVAPGRRVLVGGNGPLNLQVAVELLKAGAAVVALAEAAAAPGPAVAGALAAAAAASPGLMLRGARDLGTVRTHGVPAFHRHMVVEARGDGRVEEATIARIDAAGRVDPASRRTFAVDAVCLGAGFHPSNELARALGAEHVWDAARRQLVAVRDADGRTTAPGVFLVGDAAGLGGARVAAEEATIAAHAAADDLGRPRTPDAEGAAASARRRLARHRRFQAALWTIYAAPDPGLSLADDDTLVCRCEEVTVGTLLAAAGGGDVGAAKRASRCGMGRCQGRYCGPLLADATARAGGDPLAETGFFAPRAPVKPVPLRVAARVEEA